MDKVTVKLGRPFKSLEGPAQHFIEMRTLVTVGDMRVANKASDKNDVAFFALVVRMSGRDASEIEQLSLADYNKCVEVLDFGEEKDSPDPKG